jgi:hypothetical protein
MPEGKLHTVTLHLARSPEAPHGSSHYRYEIAAPLTEDGHLDPLAWKAHRELCLVTRWRDGDQRNGRLVHKPGGSGGATWSIDYDAATEDDDEAGYRLGSHRLVEGEYVSIRDEDDVMHTFKVVSVVPEDA